MTRIAYLDCFSGVSGNMLLGALLDCGVDQEAFRAQLSRVGLSGFQLEVEQSHKSGLRGLHITIHVGGDQPHRHLADIDAIITSSSLSAHVKEVGLGVFRRLAEAEAKVHGEPIEHIHFHEVGAVDAIIDILGTILCLEMLGVEKVIASPLPQGHGTIQSAHGLLPIPAPATSELLRGVPVYGRDVEAELVTPTGAALVVSLAKAFGPMPAMLLERTGVGAGVRDLPWANLLRIFVGQSEEAGTAGARTLEVQANIDDMNPEFFEHVMDRLFAAGALDVFLTPIQMKRGRPAIQLGMLVEESLLDSVLGIIFSETSTIGVRMHPVERRKLDRESILVVTELGKVSVKIARWEGKVVNIAPEYKDCLRIAQEKNVPLKDVYASALASARSAGKIKDVG
jgi:pyridinium-3,5-bisthiocarboxylic acid mononucleotide nickel chelatase